MDIPPIQRLQKRDIEALEALFPEIAEGQLEADYLEHLQDIRTILVAVEKDDEGERTYFGYITILWTSNYTEFWRRNIPEIVDLRVAEPYQTTASALIAACESLAREKGYVMVGVSLQQSDRTANRLYSEPGYAPANFGTTSDNNNLLYLTKSL